jgi:hypothetical protein
MIITILVPPGVLALPSDIIIPSPLCRSARE